MIDLLKIELVNGLNVKMEEPSLLQHKIEALERSQAVVELDLDGTVLRANYLFLQLTGYGNNQVVGQSYSMFVPANENQMSEYERLWTRLRSGEHVAGEFCRMNSSGHPMWVYGVYCPLLDDAGRPYRILKMVADITATKRRDADFAGQVAAIRTSQAIAEFDLDGFLLDANQNFLQMMGYPLENVRGRHHSLFVDSSERESVEYKAFWWRLRDGNYHAGLYKRLDASGATHWIQASYNPIRDENGQLTKVVKFAIDQTSSVLDHLRVEYLYRHDALTGLANRAGLKLALDAIYSQRDGAQPTLLLVDLDHMKAINDTLGHLAGDQCLITLAERIRNAAGNDTTVARLGGDEFAVLLQNGSEAAEIIAQRIVAAACEPFEWMGGLYQVGASVGVSSEGDNPSDLLKYADIALYEAKRSGRSAYRRFYKASPLSSPELSPTADLVVAT
ncbi:diguanylate cyclase [Bradyrhizobium sp. STM 3809]|uniref:diguanylate cyclase domain-containing protein n=1 Tax=Bradyrhizobium sp. STM 3809 TaxID=551936 RepID=UPI000240A323|nr:diguanylate cyclase [Bradyrhizobium sp. STM 3809]CCE03501.1 putative Diguanylate kinase [Bradyrhizobium sp. STM 3809]